jgi:hypothetical protein
VQASCTSLIVAVLQAEEGRERRGEEEGREMGWRGEEVVVVVVVVVSVR